MVTAKSMHSGWTGKGRSRETVLQLFDGFQLWVDGRAVEVPATAARLLAFLALRPGATREQVSGTLWPDALDRKAAACLRSTMWRLRKISDRLLAGSRARLTLGDPVVVDVHVWVSAVSAYLDDPYAQSVSLQDTPWAGELLPGWYDDWVLLERERQRQLHLHVLDAMADRLTAEGRYATALDAAMAALRVEPLRESTQRSLVRIHIAEGNISEAIRAYESYRRLLYVELRVAPSDKLRSLIAPYHRESRLQPRIMTRTE